MRRSVIRCGSWFRSDCRHVALLVLCGKVMPEAAFPRARSAKNRQNESWQFCTQTCPNPTFLADDLASNARIVGLNAALKGVPREDYRMNSLGNLVDSAPPRVTRIFAAQRAAFDADPYPSASRRRASIKALKR